MSASFEPLLLAFALAVLVRGPATAQHEAASGPPQEAPPASQVAKDATPVILAVGKAIGDYSAVCAVEPFRFRFKVLAAGTVAAERVVTWSPKRGLARVELQTKTGRVVGAFEIEGSKNAVENDGSRLAGAEAEKVAAQLRKTFRGDWNYFTLAHRLGDRSLVVTREGDVTEGGKSYARLAIEYDPSIAGFAGDRYGLLLDLATGLPHALFVKWKSMKPEQPPLRFDYAEWHTVGGVKLPRALLGNGNPQTLMFDGLETQVEATPADFLGLES